MGVLGSGSAGQGSELGRGRAGQGERWAGGELGSGSAGQRSNEGQENQNYTKKDPNLCKGMLLKLTVGITEVAVGEC